MMLLSIVSGLSLLSCKRQMSMPTSNVYPVMTLAATDDTIQSSYSATIKGAQDVDIYPQVSGTITRVCVKDGENVRKGQTLFVIDQVPYQAAYMDAKATVESAEADVANAQLTCESKVKLRAQKVVSAFDLQQAQNTLRAKQAALLQAKANLLKAKNNLSYTTITSPANGVAGMVSLRVGALVSAGMSSPLVTISGNSQMYAYFSVSENQLLGLARQNGQLTDVAKLMPEVVLQLSDGTQYDRKGRVDAVSGVVDKSTGAISVRAVFANHNHLLRSGSSGNVLLPLQRKGCIVIPQAATFEIQDKIFVYKVVAGKTQSTLITVTPITNGTSYIVESGLKVGDVIVSDGAGLLKDGVEVATKPAAK